jgi:hypothetical protein
MLPHHEMAKQDTIGVIRGANVKLPHHRGITLIYPKENEMPLIHHIVKQQGCSYIIKNNESLNERTQKHPKTKPKSRLMQAGWEQGKVLNWDGHGGLD